MMKPLDNIETYVVRWKRFTPPFIELKTLFLSTLSCLFRSAQFAIGRIRIPRIADRRII